MPDPIIRPDTEIRDVPNFEWKPPIRQIQPAYDVPAIVRPIPPAHELGRGYQWQSPNQTISEQQGPAADIPYGPVPGQQQLRNDYQNLGNIRPFGPGEFVRMPNGNITSEETYTTELSPGQWAVIPGLWIVNGVPTHVNADQAREYAIQSGLLWPYTYPTSEQADQYADQREMLWNMFQGDTTKQPPLWSRPWPPRK
jgi:hypothetical protein